MDGWGGKKHRGQGTMRRAARKSKDNTLRKNVAGMKGNIKWGRMEGGC